jgi:GTP pyrophosphokinase
MKFEDGNLTFSKKIHSFEDKEQERILKCLELVNGRSVGAASILLDLGLDADTIIAALIRLLPVPHEALLDQFGSTVALLVNGAKKIDSLKTDNRTVQEAENIRNILFVLTGDIRVIFIKLAEKLHSLRVFDSSPGDERKIAARECLDIYAPIADRLGISRMKNEMEDLSLKFINRETFQQIKDIVSEKQDHRNKFLEFSRKTIMDEAKAAGINVEVESRAKHFYSVYMKMRKRNKTAAEIFDLSGIRIICDTIENCYTLLGIVHRLGKSGNGTFRDYIAKPKPNGYQSLHTTIKLGTGDIIEENGEDEKLLEIQIRTQEMHHMAENGIASHWLYKKGSSRDMMLQHEAGIINRLKDWKHGGDNLLEDIKREMLKKCIYVFTPQGKIIKLPAGATPIDFAYHIHTAVGEHCIGAKANGHIIPLKSQLKNSQVVEILTNASARPHFNWLQLAKSAKTRSKIRSWLEKNDETYSSEKTPDLKKKPVFEPPAPAIPPLPDKTSHVQKVIQPLTSVLQVRIEDEKNMMVRFARCCYPVPGDSITGYVSRGRGIIIHRKNCGNLANNPEVEKRKIDVEWENAGSKLIKRFRIEAKFSANLFSEIEGAIRKRQGHLIEGRLEETAGNKLSGLFTMQIIKTDDLKPVIKNIRGIPGVLSLTAISDGVFT